MGVTGLIPYTKLAQTKTHIRKYSGCTAAIDATVWLYKGSYACANHLALDKDTDVYINYCMNYLNLLKKHKVKPIMIFDGKDLPIKDGTIQIRSQKRKSSKEKGLELYEQGKKREAYEYFKQSLHVTRKMVHKLIDVLRSEGIDYIVSPYESDSQLTYLSINNIADIVITEDSDLIVFGCKKILFKLSSDGYGVLYDASLLYKCISMPIDTEFDVVLRKLRLIAILSGCDYLKNIKSIGLSRARKIVDEYSDMRIDLMIKEIPVMFPKINLDTPDDYIQDFCNANFTFLHQPVFNVIDKKQINLHDIEPEPFHITDINIAGIVESDTKICVELGIGKINHKYPELNNDYTLDEYIKTYKEANSQNYPSVWEDDFMEKKKSMAKPKKTKASKKPREPKTQTKKVKVDKKSPKKRPLKASEENVPSPKRSRRLRSTKKTNYFQ